MKSGNLVLKVYENLCCIDMGTVPVREYGNFKKK